MDDSSRCCNPVMSKPAAACLRLVSPFSRYSRSWRYSSRSANKRSSGASAGSPSMSNCTTLRFGKAALDFADVVLEPANHHVVEHPFLDRHATAESLRVEDLQERGEAVGVAVVRRGRQEQAVLETRGQVANGTGDLRVDGVLLPAGRRGMVGLVQDQQRAAAEVAQPIAQRAGIRLVDQQPVRDQESRVRAPRIHAVAPLAPRPRHVVLVENLEGQTEAGLQFVLPLREHRGRAADDDLSDLLAQEQLAGDQPGLDRLAEANVVGDEQIDPWQEQGLAERLKLVGVESDASPEWRLEQARVRSP